MTPIRYMKPRGCNKSYTVGSVKPAANRFMGLSTVYRVQHRHYWPAVMRAISA